MPDPRGFLTVDRRTAETRPVDVRIMSWQEVYEDLAPEAVSEQASRCMDCGIPFCHNGCPLGNLIPEWNDLVWRKDWTVGADRLHATNNFPEITGRVCPAPCESACVAGIAGDAVSIKQIEVAIANQVWQHSPPVAMTPNRLTERTVAVVGSGPAGLAAAQQLTRAGHTVVVYERADRIGGLLRYGIPEFKLEKRWLDLRLEQMVAEGTRFKTGVNVGEDITLVDLRRRFDAVILAVGATIPRDLDVEGRDLTGIHHAMDYLVPANRQQQGDLEVPAIDAVGRDVLIIGGGDTGADCLGTAHRQGARSVTQLEIMPMPPDSRDPSTPWPTWPLLLRTSSAHEEGGKRVFSVSTQRFLGDATGAVRAVELVEVAPRDGAFAPIANAMELPTDLVLLALGFAGPDLAGLPDVRTDGQSTIQRGVRFEARTPGVFVAGDAGRGQSLVVWAIAEGRSCAAAVDEWLMGERRLPAPVLPTDRPLTA